MIYNNAGPCYFAGRCHAGRRRDFRRIDSARHAQGHDGVHEDHLRTAQDTPERLQEDLGRE